MGGYVTVTTMRRQLFVESTKCIFVELCDAAVERTRRSPIRKVRVLAVQLSAQLRRSECSCNRVLTEVATGCVRHILFFFFRSPYKPPYKLISRLKYPLVFKKETLAVRKPPRNNYTNKGMDCRWLSWRPLQPCTRTYQNRLFDI